MLSKEKCNEERIFSLRSKRFYSIRIDFYYDHNGNHEFCSCKKIDFITNTASAQALKLAVKELNIRETLTWTNIKLSKDGWIDDSAVFAAVDTDLGLQYNWGPKAEITGGELHFKSKKFLILRTASSNVSVAIWR